MLILDAAAGLLLTVSVLWCAYALACRLTKDAGAATRFTAAAIILFWQLTVAFLLLSAVRLFVRPVALAGWFATAMLAHQLARSVADPATQFRKDLAAIRAWWASLNRPFRLLIGVGTGMVLVRVVHGLLAPCMTWDALTYHLYRPAVWVQAHGLTSTAGPDAAGYYTWFPIYGDAVWGWWLQAMRGDVAIAPIAAGMWLMIPLACYACARTLDVPPVRATGAAIAVAFTPAVINFAAAVYVDNLAVALYVAAAAFLARACAYRRDVDAVLGAAALAVLVGVKGGVVLPACAVGIASALVLAGSRVGALAVLLVSVPAFVPSLMAWMVTGSPLYPLTIRAGGRVLFEGHPQLEWLVHAGWMSDAFIADARTRVLGRLFFPWEPMTADFLNLGLGPLCLIPALVPGLRTVWRSKPSRYAAAFLMLGACLTVASVLGDANQGLRLWWWGLMGRLVTIALAAAVLIAAAWPSKLSTACLWLCGAAGLAVAWPRGLSPLDFRAAQFVLPAVVVTAAGVWIAGRVVPRVRVPLRWGAVVVIVAALIDARDRFRYEFYEAAAGWEAYDVHPIDHRWTSSWPVWQRLDRDRPVVMAVSAGWDGIGHNWYRYPLLGRRLQNRLLYIPITRNGSLIDYDRAASPETPVSCEAWLERVLASSAEYFVMLAPMPPEQRWASALPDVFVPELQIRPFETTLYHINRGGRKASCGPTASDVKIP